MSAKRLKRLDEEDEKLVDELLARTQDEKLTLDGLLGFQVPEVRCLVPPVPCGMTAAPVMSLVPLYEAVLLPVYSSYWPEDADKPHRITKVSIFEKQHCLNPTELVILAEKGRVIPYFHDVYESYDEKIISPLLQPGVPRITPTQMHVIKSNPLFLMQKEKNWTRIHRLARKDSRKFKFPHQDCVDCLSACYMMGLREYFNGPKFIGWRVACFMSYVLSTRVFDAVLQTECGKAKEILSNVGGLPDAVLMDYILEGLKVNYTVDISIEAYLDVFDGKTSKALRKIMADLLNDPLSRKYTQRLSAKIFDLNQQVEDLAEGKAAKVFEAISDMALYGGEKFIESKTQQYIKIPKKGLVKIGEWLASKGIDLQTKLGRKDWSIAQLYKARCKLQRCK